MLVWCSWRAPGAQLMLWAVSNKSLSLSLFSTFTFLCSLYLCESAVSLVVHGNRGDHQACHGGPLVSLHSTVTQAVTYPGVLHRLETFPCLCSTCQTVGRKTRRHYSIVRWSLEQAGNGLLDRKTLSFPVRQSLAKTQFPWCTSWQPRLGISVLSLQIRHTACQKEGQKSASSKKSHLYILKRTKLC